MVALEMMLDAGLNTEPQEQAFNGNHGSSSSAETHAEMQFSSSGPTASLHSSAQPLLTPPASIQVALPASFVGHLSKATPADLPALFQLNPRIPLKTFAVCPCPFVTCIWQYESPTQMTASILACSLERAVAFTCRQTVGTVHQKHILPKHADALWRLKTYKRWYTCVYEGFLALQKIMQAYWRMSTSLLLLASAAWA